MVAIILYLMYNKLNTKSQIPSVINAHKKIKKIKKTKHKKKKNSDTNKDLVFFEIGFDGKKLGKIVIELYYKIVPLTCKNFRTLCSNQSYKGSSFHRIIKNFMIQGGKIDCESIYGSTFKDENFKLKHKEPYLLSMANRGTDTNGTQFFITTAPAPHLDSKHVVFGKVISGFEIVDHLNFVNTDHNDKPTEDYFIINCGKIKT